MRRLIDDQYDNDSTIDTGRTVGRGRGRGNRRRSGRGGHMRHDHIHHAHHGRGGRHRARRGAIVEAILLVLGERPMHGYELITELETRSDGRWRPSPGAIYPALNRMEERGLVTADEVDGKNRFSLTVAGRERREEYLASPGGDAAEPWNDTGTGRRGDLRGHVAELVGQVRQVGRFGTPEQIEQAGAVLTEAKRKLYAILATEPTPEPESQPSDDAD